MTKLSYDITLGNTVITNTTSYQDAKALVAERPELKMRAVYTPIFPDDTPEKAKANKIRIQKMKERKGTR